MVVWCCECGMSAADSERENDASGRRWQHRAVGTAQRCSMASTSAELPSSSSSSSDVAANFAALGAPVSTDAPSSAPADAPLLPPMPNPTRAPTAARSWAHWSLSRSGTLSTPRSPRSRITNTAWIIGIWPLRRPSSSTIRSSNKSLSGKTDHECLYGSDGHRGLLMMGRRRGMRHVPSWAIRPSPASHRCDDSSLCAQHLRMHPRQCGARQRRNRQLVPGSSRKRAASRMPGVPQANFTQPE